MSPILPFRRRKTVMVSVVCYGPLVDYLKTLGFTKAKGVDMSKVDLEVTGGYSSYLRGDKGSNGGQASVFSGRSYDLTGDTKLRKGSISFGMHTQKHEQWMDDYPIAHFVGPEDDLRGLLQKIIGDSWPDLHLGSFSGDLEIALLGLDVDDRRIRDCTDRGDACK